MAAKFALIVDDSRMAQVKLRKMLARYEMDVDCVASAEEALSYLARRRPAVVFMDHLMKGMDGFEALRVIKSNPDTATVPVIMYTSKSGDLYVGQARALGAMDVLSKDVIEPSSLDKVLAAVKIFPMREATMAFPAVKIPAEKPETPAGAELEPQRAAGDTLRAQIARMLDIHIVRIIQEIGDNNRLMAKRLFREMQELKDRLMSAPAAPVPARLDADMPRPAASPPAPRFGNAPWILIGVLSIALTLVFYQLQQNGRQQASMNDQYARLNEFIETQYGSVTLDNRKLNKKLALGQNLSVKTQHLYEGLAWAINRGNFVPFGQQALDEKQLEVLSRLVYYLHTANFSGVISVKLFFGNFCVAADASGQFTLPKPETPASACYFLEDRLADMSVESQQAWPFTSYLMTTPEIHDGRIRVELESMGTAEPMLEYPPLNGSTAGEWNRVAAVNNHVVYIITPDT
ncbi:MAG TPA: response regulator [Gammaproteobacteria bacterium]|nr:response regulator [Gammaproteobacteria bacterium]